MGTTAGVPRDDSQRESGPYAAVVLSGLIEALAVLLAGAVLLRIGFRSGHRTGAFTSAFWQTFFRFAGYRLKRLYAVPLLLAGTLCIGWGAALLYTWIRAFYAARLGHFGP